MAVPFGFSVGDFVAGIGLVRDIIDALQTSSSSAARYQGLLSELFALEGALLEVKKLCFNEEQVAEANRLGGEALLGALQRAAIQCQDSIDKLLAKVKKYEGHLTTHGSGSKWKDALRKVQWALLTDKELAESRAEIRGHSSLINMLLTIVQLEMMRLQAQKNSQDQMNMIRWLRGGYAGTMSSLTGALNRAQFSEAPRNCYRFSGPELPNLRESGSNSSIRLNPRTVEFGEPIYFVDAFGQQTRFHLDFVYSPSVLEDWLKRRFREIGRERIVKREFALEDMKTKRQITFSQEWQNSLYSGMRLGMDMIYEGHPDQFNSCPRCKLLLSGASDDDVDCPNCGVHFRRITDTLNIDDQWKEKEESASHDQLQIQQTNKSTENIPETYRSGLARWIERMNQEYQQMQAFKRFRFQPTKAELDLAVIDPVVFITVFDAGPSSGFKGDSKVAEDAYRKLLNNVDIRAPRKPSEIMGFEGLNNLAGILIMYGRYDEAAKILIRLIEQIEGGPVSTLEFHLDALLNLACVRSLEGDYEDAEKILLQACGTLDNSNWDGLNFHPLVAQTMFWNNLAFVYTHQQREQEALDLQADALDQIVNLAFELQWDSLKAYRIKLECNYNYIETLQV